MRGITIKPALNGFICRVGCQEVVFESVGRLINELEKYLENPQEMQDSYMKNAINAKWVNDVAQDEAVDPPADCERDVRVPFTRGR